jgi:hypothetical protein
MSKTIQLTKGKVTVVSDEDHEEQNQWSWSACKTGNKWYAVRKSNGKIIKLHRVIAGAENNVEVDHINGDGLDNRRENLRLCNTSENNRNRGKSPRNKTGYKGVSREGTQYRAQISIYRKDIYIGSFGTAEAAAHAYDEAAKKHHGPFARLNFPGGAK